MTEGSQHLWAKANRLFERNDHDGDPNRSICLINRLRPGPLLVSVHGINHFAGPSNEDRKVADLYTGGLVRALSFELRLPAIFVCSRKIEINPHLGSTAVNELINALALSGRASMILDFHGARDNDHFDVALGTGGPATKSQHAVINQLTEALSSHGLRVAINPVGYAGMNPQTIVSRHRGLGIGVIQIEIVRKFRSPMTSVGQRFYCALKYSVGAPHAI